MWLGQSGSCNDHPRSQLPLTNWPPRINMEYKHTFVPPHPNLKAASCANSSPNPSMSPLMNGKNRLIAAPLAKLQNVGGEYRISGELDAEGGDGDIERSSGPELEYCSLSDRMVMPESARGFWSAMSRWMGDAKMEERGFRG